MPRWQAEEEWAEPPIPWNELWARWNQSRDLLEDKIRKFPIENLAKRVSGRSYAYETMALMDCATRDIPFRADRDGLEHAPAPVPFSVYLRAPRPFAVRTPCCRELFVNIRGPLFFLETLTGVRFRLRRNVR